MPAAPLTALEVAYGLPLGRDAVPPLPDDASLTPREALEGVLRDALARPPCLMSFSGGRDSSALLAAAVHVARREGLPDPVPATLVFPGVAEADEEEWQARVLGHLGLGSSEWIRLRFTDELDVIGPVARGMLERHGLMWPFNLHMHAPIIEAAAGGTVVTGFAGDEIARSSANLHAERVMAARRFRRPRDLASIAYRLAPAPIKYPFDFARCGSDLAGVTWLTRRGRIALRRRTAADWAAVPAGWRRVLLGVVWRSRYIRVCVHNFAELGRDYDVRLVHPFVEAPVLQALAGTAPFAGLGRRGDLLETLVGDLLPTDIVRRSTKGGFTSPLWTDTMRRFAAQWSGDGLDTRLVDAERLREAWLAEERPLLSTTLLQAAWLTEHGGTR